jgi:hypothetical protein
MSRTLKVALIGAAAVIVAALIGIYPSLRGHSSSGATIAGIVVDRDTNQGISQATIVIAGRDEQYTTEDSGNFRFEIRTDAPPSVRLHVSKNGFQPLDKSVALPAENLVLQLHKQ